MVGCWPRPQQLKRPGGRLPSTAGVDGLPRLLNLPSNAITQATGALVMAQKHAVVHDTSQHKRILLLLLLKHGTEARCLLSMGSTSSSP